MKASLGREDLIEALELGPVDKKKSGKALLIIAKAFGYCPLQSIHDYGSQICLGLIAAEICCCNTLE